MEFALSPREDAVNQLPSYSEPPRDQKHYPHIAIKICYCTNGEGSIWVNRERHKFGKGTLMVIRSDADYEIEPPKTDDFKVEVIPVPLFYFLNDQRLEEVFVSLRMLLHGNVVLRYQIKPQIMLNIKDLLEKIMQESRWKPYRYKLVIQSCLRELFVYLEREDISGDHIKRKVTEIEDNGIFHPAIEKIKEYIRDHYKDILTVDLLAEKFHISKTYLCALFKKATGTTIVHYIMLYRVNRSIDLLCQTNESISHIALDIGFNNCSYYSKIFKRITGKTPKEYRTLPEMRNFP